MYVQPTMRKINIVQDLKDNIVAQLEAAGFLILSDSWVTDSNKNVFCIDNKKSYPVLEFKRIELTMLKPEHQRLPAACLRDGFSNWQIKTFSCIRVENQEEINPGFKLIAM